MKILAIRGSNLASLAGPFEVDFTGEPLRSAGLFAICGQTGAGKSTLLDALCLALYDNTPRLSKAGAKTLPDVADTVLTQQDARNLLRRGSAEGHAEVDFLGNDGHSYRARWSVRRAYGKASGSLQNTAMSLKRLPDLQAVGGTNREVKAEIIARIGLSFEQFTRAVLLAQNEFSAFLKADDNERGELLETLTGSALYTQLSQRAFTRAKEEKAALDRLTEKLADARPLDEAERGALEAEARLAREQAERLEQRQHSLQTLLRWYEDDAVYCHQQDEGAALLRQRRQEQSEAAPRRLALERIEAVQPARALVAELDRLRQEDEQAHHDLRQGRARIDQALQAATGAGAQLQQAQKTLAYAEQAWRDAAPQLEQARLLDARLHALQAARQDAERAAQEARRCLAEVQQNRDSAAKAQDSARQTQQELDAWMEEHASLQALAEQWPRWDSLFKQAQQRDEERSRQDAALAAIGRDEAAHAVALAAGQAKLDAAHLTLEQAEKARSQSQAHHAAIDTASLQQRKREAEARREQLREAGRIAEQMGVQQERLDALRRQGVQLEQEAAAAGAELQQVQGRLPALEAALVQAERSQHLAEMACADSVEHLRARLEPDAPCPVCGSHEHPYAAERPQLHGLLENLRAQVAECRAHLQQAHARQAELAAQQSAARRQKDGAQAELEKVQAALEQQQRAWQAHPLAGELPEPQAASCWLAAQLEKAGAALQALEEQDQAWRKACEERDQLQSAYESALREQTAARDALALAQTAQQQSATARQVAQAAHRQESERLDALLAELGAAFAGRPGSEDWRAQWQAGPGAFYAGCEAKARQWLTRHAARDEGRQRLATLALELGSLQDACSRLQAEQSRAATVLASSENSLKAAQDERIALLSGAPVAEVETRLQQAIATAREHQESRRHALAEAQQEHIRCSEAVAHASARIERLAVQQAEAAARLAAWVDSRPAALRALLEQDAEPVAANYPALRALLQTSQDEIAIERASLQALDALVQQAQAVLQERIERCRAHQAKRPHLRLLEELRGTALHGANAGPEPASPPAWLPQAGAFSGDLFADDTGIAEPELEAAAESSLDDADPIPLLQAALATLAGEREAAQSRSTALALALAQDDARRRQSSTMLEQIRQQEGRQRLWAQMNELIGSSDGKKFRNHAQQYTLDVLIGYANRHLYDLARRYRLQRIPETLALMVVDQDMGDEARSVHSLSGGESFLVSLALALALASLSSNRVQVESLFIDEGFGSLDADTLRVAMDALDGLQALGRKVGVISHVQEMTERIATRITVHKTAGGKSSVRVG